MSKLNGISAPLVRAFGFGKSGDGVNMNPYHARNTSFAEHGLRGHVVDLLSWKLGRHRWFTACPAATAYLSLNFPGTTLGVINGLHFELSLDPDVSVYLSTPKRTCKFFI